MKEYTEFEARWINLDEKTIREKLNVIGAKKSDEFFFKEWIFQRQPEWEGHHRRIRVRTDGKTTWLTYKANKTWTVDSTEEVELIVSSAEDAVKFLKAADIPQIRYQEKKRIRYALTNIIFELDFWPKIPMVVEIEAPSEEGVREGAKLLGLAWNDAIFVDQKFVHSDFYGIKLDEIADYRF